MTDYRNSFPQLQTIAARKDGTNIQAEAMEWSAYESVGGLSAIRILTRLFSTIRTGGIRVST
jgi:hypothetical protein